MSAEQMPESFYRLKTPDGDVWAKDYVFRGKQFRQTTLMMGQLLSLSDLLADLDLKGRDGVADVSDIGFDISVTKLARVLLKSRMYGKALAILLEHSDGTSAAPEEFEGGTAGQFLAFVEEVVLDFFTFNPDVCERLGEWFAKAAEKGVARLMNVLQRIGPFISSALATSQKKSEYSGSDKNTLTSGSVKPSTQPKRKGKR